jgi:hypothetical protein
VGLFLTGFLSGAYVAIAYVLVASKLWERRRRSKSGAGRGASLAIAMLLPLASSAEGAAIYREDLAALISAPHRARSPTIASFASTT